MDLNYFINQLVNTSFLAYAFATATVIVVIILLAAGNKGQIKMAIAGISIPIILIGAIFLWDDGKLQLPLINLLTNNDAAVAASTAEAIVPVVNVQVDVPEQAPPTVIVQSQNVPEVVDNEPVPERAGLRATRNPRLPEAHSGRARHRVSRRW